MILMVRGEAASTQFSREFLAYAPAGKFLRIFEMQSSAFWTPKISRYLIPY